MSAPKKVVIRAGETFVPPDAQGDSVRESWWRQNVFERLGKHVLMTRSTAEEDLDMIFGSFRSDLLRKAVAHRWDLMPLLLKGAGVETSWIREPLLGILSNNSVLLLTLLRGRGGWGPYELREVIRRKHPEKAAIFDTLVGWMWFDWTCYNFARWIYVSAKLRGRWWYPTPDASFKLTPPPNTIEIQT